MQEPTTKERGSGERTVTREDVRTKRETVTEAPTQPNSDSHSNESND